MNRLPAEWETQDGVMLTWPQSNNHWGDMTPEVASVFLNLAKIISQRETLLVVCKNASQARELQTQFANTHVNLDQTHFHYCDADDVWARDHGPLFVETPSGLACFDFEFNGWGNKYPFQQDNQITRSLVDAGVFSNSKHDPQPIVLEGGSIDTNGQGVLIATRSSIATETRNPNHSQVELESILKDHFGLSKLIWLEHGALAGDDTDGHIDTLVRFVDPTTIVAVNCTDPNDAHFSEIGKMNAELQQAIKLHDLNITVHHLPWPAPITNSDGQRLPATYANFLILNNAIIMPTYRQSTDKIAIDVLQKLCPSHEVIGVDALPLIHQFGSIHCVTMQLPKGSLTL